MSDLKACPFCGRIPDIEDCGEHRWFIRCKCGIAQDKLFFQKCDAVRAWNKRKELRVKDTNVPITDTISRREAKEVADQVWAKTGDANAAVISQLIEELPSAEPELATNLQQTCNQVATDRINRQAAINELCDNCDNVKAVCAHYPCKQYIAIERLPSAEPRKGKWIVEHDPVFADRYHCSRCGSEPPIKDSEWYLSNFCPTCGADLRGDGNDN